MIGSDRTKTVRLATGVAAVALVAAACGGSSGSNASGAPTGGATSGDGGAGAITANSVTVGNIAVLSGPIPGLFQGSPYGVDAYFAMVNDSGGVNGRMLKVVSADDALNCNENAKQTEKLVGETFAFVGNFSVYDDCGVPTLTKHPDFPDVSYPLGEKTKTLPNVYSPQPAPAGYRTGPFTYYKQKFDATKVGSLYGEGAAATSFEEQAAAMKSVGYDIVYKRQISNTETNFTSDVIRMKSEGVNFLYLTDLNVPNIARVLNAAKQQNWKPKLVSASPIYDASFFTLLGDPSAAEGVQIDQGFAMFLGEDRDSVPGVGDFLTWMNKTHPDFHPDLFALNGWTAAALFVQALRDAGSNPTQQGVLDALAKIHSFDANGLIPTTDVGAKKPTECWMLVTVHDGKFVRELPDKGFTCEPGGYFRTK